MKSPFEYPIDYNEIIRKKRKYKREYENDNKIYLKKRIAILGGSTTAEIKNILELYLLRNGIKPVFYESEYNKFYEDIMFENNKLENFQPDVIYIHTTNINISYYPHIKDSYEDVEEKFAEQLYIFKSIWSKIQEKYGCLIIQNNFELPYYRNLGNLEFSDFHGKTNFIMRLNNEFANYSQRNKNFYINDINYLSAKMGLDKWVDMSFWYAYKYALSYEAIPTLVQNITKIINAIYGKSKKCLVVDLDNTLWGGVIGDDGLNNIKIGTETSVGEAYAGFQRYIKELKDRGIILAVCSKNDNKIALEGISHPSNILKKDDFAIVSANWNPKYENIVEISQKLNIGFDSIVFIDDNIMERYIVKSQLSLVEVPEIGQDVIKFSDFIDNEGYFEPANISYEDINRSAYYDENFKREELKSKFNNYESFLESLNMSSEIRKFQPIYLERITQLINKTNQFNFTTKRYTYAQIECISKDKDYIAIYGNLTDKFGDNGIVSIIIGKINESILVIDLWVMSCRVLNRGMEYCMFDELVELCKKKDIKEIIGYYYRTEKNNMLSQKYKEFGFDNISMRENGDSIWKYSIPNSYQCKNKFIKRRF